jgi:hypothetical protein
MLDPYKCTMKEACDYAQDLKRSFGEIRAGDSVTLQHSEQQFLILFLMLSHPSGGRIDWESAKITIARKPVNCDRFGTAQTCCYIQPTAQSQFHPVWFADCRKMLRSQLLRERGVTPAPIAA